MLPKTRHQIIGELFRSKEFNDCIGKMQPEHLREDLKAEVMVALCELDEARLIEIYKTGGLTYYTVRIILNMIQSNTSPFYKKYRQVFNQFMDGTNAVEEIDHELEGERVVEIKNYISSLFGEEDFELRQSKEQFEHSIAKWVDEQTQCQDNEYWYCMKMLQLYIELGSYRKIEEETGIAWQSARDSVQYAISIIKYKLRQNAITTPITS